MSQSALSSAFSALSDLHSTKYTYVVSMTLMLWDIIVTFSQEVNTVWITPMSMGKLIFFANRYIPPILFSFDLYYQLHPSPSVEFCKHAFMPPNVLGIFSLSLVEFILVLRTYALYHNKILFAFLSFFCVIAGTTMITVTSYMYDNLMEFVPDTLPGEVGCIPQCTSSLCRSLLTAFWIPFFVCETFIFGLTLMKMIRSSGEIQYYSKLIKIFFRDGFIYYFVIMSISVANLLVWILAPISLAYIATSLMRSLQVTAGSRLLLNLRGVINNEYDSTVKSSRMSFQQAETGSSLGGRR